MRLLLEGRRRLGLLGRRRRVGGEEAGCAFVHRP